MASKIRVEFHCHTGYSKDSQVSIEKLLEACRQKGIDRLAITDHNTITGARQAYLLDPQRVIIGEEIKTRAGELLALFVQEEIPKGLLPQDAIHRLRQQGAFISVSHPFDSARNGAWARADLLEIAPLVDAIEVFNSRCVGEKPNREAQEFAREHHLSGTVGSDAHILWEVGRATLRLVDFRDAEGLRQSIQQAEAQVSYSPSWVHLASTWARLAKKSKPKNESAAGD